MSRLATLARAAALAAALAPGAARACGAFYGAEVTVDPAQEILIAHRDGVETYVFRPGFCGVAAEFGLILPVPASLSAAPTLTDEALVTELRAYTAPTEVKSCEQYRAFNCGGTGSGDGAPGDGGGPPAVDVVDRGRVGIFDWVLLTATSTAAFTDWLDQHGFPHGDASTAYQAYVDAGWSFVAFRVTAAASAPPPGSQLCGSFGPIQLTFPAAQPVVPARIAGLNSGSVTWRVHLLATSQQRVTRPQDGAWDGIAGAALYFSGTLRPDEMTATPALAAFAREGERLTTYDVRFAPSELTDDLRFEPAPYTYDFRKEYTTWIECPKGCTVGGAAPVALLGTLAALLGAARRRRRPTHTA